MINSYPNIFNLGHAAVATLLHGPVIVEEKIDGSQISFRRIDLTDEVISPYGSVPYLEVRSKGAVINTEAPEKMFKKAVEILKSIENDIPVGYTFRGEYLSKPKHNVAAYDRVPANHIIIFDIEKSEQAFLNYADKQVMAQSLGFETVPVLYEGMVVNAGYVRDLLDRESVLGGQKVEGVVIKPAHYDLFGRDKKVLMGKFVTWRCPSWVPVPIQGRAAG
jgi:ATP-dependent RNA circularization protein (DNA/RNA ligase family)